ncbi:MAG UNVERIFIED_CONTAM: hypothetical protein LVR29_10810 [Microcystis novacekii LVE1205-3]
MLRLARQFDAAADLLTRRVATEWENVRLNEWAALAWHSGETDAALSVWRKLSPSAVVLFNLGMAQLFAGNSAEAASHLRQAASAFPKARHGTISQACIWHWQTREADRARSRRSWRQEEAHGDS